MKTRRQKVFSILVACLLCASLFCVPVSAADDVISIDISNLQSDAKFVYTEDEFDPPDFSNLSIFNSSEINKYDDSFSFSIPAVYGTDNPPSSITEPSPYCCFLTFNLIDPISVSPDHSAVIETGSFSLNLLDRSSYLISFFVCLFDSSENLIGVTCVDAVYYDLVNLFEYSFDNLSIPISGSGEVSYISLAFWLSSQPSESHSYDVVFNDIFMNVKLVAMESFLSQVGIFFSQSFDWLGDVFSVIVSTPALLIFILACVICGFAIGLLDRMKNTR